jgi:hypothetical protein
MQTMISSYPERISQFTNKITEPHLASPYRRLGTMSCNYEHYLLQIGVPFYEAYIFQHGPVKRKHGVQLEFELKLHVLDT